MGIRYDRTISGDSNITAVRLKRHNGDTEEVMGYWMIELYDDGKVIYSPSRIINPLWYKTDYSRSCAKAILLHFLLRDQSRCGNMKRDN